MVLSIKLASSEEYFSGNMDGEGKSRALSRTRLFLDFGLVMNQPYEPNSAGVIPKDAITGSSTA